jgi:peptidoglycan pentaglycine glycine transferase (the first glycine)
MEPEKQTPSTAWDAFVAGNGGSFLQSWDWGEFQIALGRNVERIAEADVACTMLTLPLPFGRRYAYCPRGPVLRKDADPKAIVTIVDLLKSRMATKTDFLRFEPEFPAARTDIAMTLQGTGFVRGPETQPAHTSIIDLTRAETELLAAMHQKTRYNIRVAERNGVKVRIMREPARGDRDAFWQLLDETADRDGFSTHERQYYETMFDVLGASVSLAIAEHAGTAIAAALLIDFAGRRTYLHGASSSQQRNLMAPYLLHWEAMRQAKSAGMLSYDFWGVAPAESPDHPWAGISRFKRGFGGEDVAYLGTWELPFHRFWYTVYRQAKRFRR